MLSVYSNGKVFGCYIIVTCILSVVSVSSFASSEKWIKTNLREDGDFEYYKAGSSKSCSEEGRGEMTQVESIRLLNQNVFEDIMLMKNNSSYKSLIEKVTRECNGKPHCSTSHRKISKPTFLNLQDISVKEVQIHFLCKPTKIDNEKVFDIGLNLDSKKLNSQKEYYLVLRLQNNNTHRRCKMDGIEANIEIKVLYVDFEPNSACNNTNSDSRHQCHGNMTSFSRVSTKCNYTWQPSITFQIFFCKADDVHIDIHMSTGFVWIELKGDKDFNLNCSGSNSNNHGPSHKSSTADTTQAPTTTTSVTTAYNPTVPTDSTHSNTNKTSVDNGNGSNTNKAIDSDPFDYVNTIIIPASVAFLALLTVIVSFVFCVCRRNSRFQVWKRSRGESAHRDRKDDEYDNVNSHEDLDPTYNIVNAPVATDAKKRTRPVSKTTKPRVPSTAQQTPLKPIKTPTPTDSSGPSRKVEQQGEGAPDGANGDLYATVNKVKKVEAAASSGTSTNHGNVTQANMADSDGAEYSHLANFGKKRNYENIYNG